MIQKNASSDDPGHVLEVANVGPLDKPRERFFCMSLSFEMKCSAAGIGYDSARERIWVTIGGIAENEAEGGALICKM